MKKIIIIIAITIVFLSALKDEVVIIPKESIRFRIIANSNTEEDQKIKLKVLNNISKELNKTTDINNIEGMRKFINKELPVFNRIVEKTLNENNYKNDFHINYGKNYFPEKKYKNVKYEEGEYESLVITLGDGEGKNFWCVLFPPLCLVDESNNDIEYKSIVKEIINKYF